MIVESSSEHGHLAESEQGMIENIFKIEELTAGEICTHRLDIVALPLDADFKTVEATLAGNFFSRVPVYADSLDDIRGFLHTKDVFNYMATNSDFSGFDIKALMREAYFVPPSKSTEELLREMRKDGSTLAVVIDEYGGTLGIITLEDLIESIVGSIQDEYDSEEIPDITSIGEGVFRVQGMAGLQEIQNHFDVTLPTDMYETISGFLIGQLGHIPADDEKPEMSYECLHFKVERVLEKRIATVIVTKTESQISE
jgi:putative hemolysin